jgi:phage-related protein
MADSYTFPAEINQPSSITITRVDKTESAETYGGYKQVRLKTKRAMHKYEIRWDALPQDQYDILMDFDAQMGYGSISFSWTMPPRWNDAVPKTVRMTGELKVTRVSKRHVSLSISLEEV